MRDYQAQILTLNDLVPADDFMRKLEANLDLTFVYTETDKLYSHRYGRPPIDPVVLVKYLLVGRSIWTRFASGKYGVRGRLPRRNGGIT